MSIKLIQSEANTIMGRNARIARLLKDGGIMPKVRKLAALIIRGRRKYRGKGRGF